MSSQKEQVEAIRLGVFIHQMFDGCKFYPMDARRFANIQTVMTMLMEGVDVISKNATNNQSTTNNPWGGVDLMERRRVGLFMKNVERSKHHPISNLEIDG